MAAAQAEPPEDLTAAAEPEPEPELEAEAEVAPALVAEVVAKSVNHSAVVVAGASTAAAVAEA